MPGPIFPIGAEGKGAVFVANRHIPLHEIKAVHRSAPYRRIAGLWISPEPAVVTPDWLRLPKGARPVGHPPTVLLGGAPFAV